MATMSSRCSLVVAVTGLLVLPAAPAHATDLSDIFFRLSCHSVGVTTGEMLVASSQASSEASSQASTAATSEDSDASESAAKPEPQAEAAVAAAQHRDQVRFVVANYANLRRDIAAAGGEYIQAYAALLGCLTRARPTLVHALRDRYSWLYSGDFTPVEVGEQMLAVIGADQRLAAACARVAAKSAGSP